MNRKLVALYPREYRLIEGGPIKTDWIECGIAWQNERGIDLRLWFTPPATQDPVTGLQVRIKLREPRESQPAARAAEPEPGAAAPRPPEHRDQLAAQGTLRGIPTGTRRP